MSMDWQAKLNMAEMQLMKTKQAMKNMPVKMQMRTLLVISRRGTPLPLLCRH